MKILPDSLLEHFRQSELKLAKSILRWKLQKEGSVLPHNSELDAAASRLLDEARKIAKKMLKVGMDIETIATMTDLSPSEITELNDQDF